jgi:NAD(P)-dependent dehydrogenase (short-subunit alcohol dehydrogenase family)
MPNAPPKLYPDIYPFLSPGNFKDAHAGKVVLITGAGGDIAQQISKHFALSGATLAVTDIALDRLDSTVALCREHGAKVVPFACNISKETEVQGLIKDVQGQLGDIDILVNAAGVCTSKPIFLDSFAAIWREMEINLGGVDNPRFSSCLTRADDLHIGASDDAQRPSQHEGSRQWLHHQCCVACRDRVGAVPCWLLDFQGRCY